MEFVDPALARALPGPRMTAGGGARRKWWLMRKRCDPGGVTPGRRWHRAVESTLEWSYASQKTYWHLRMRAICCHNVGQLAALAEGEGLVQNISRPPAPRVDFAPILKGKNPNRSPGLLPISYFCCF